MMKISSQKTRFISVGIINTLIDFGVLFALKTLGVPVLFANILSTSTAFGFSFFANKNYTFKSKGAEFKRELPLFIGVTLFGLWVIQTVVIKMVLFALEGLNLPGDTTLIIAKLCATSASLVWNYVLYSRVVFKKNASAGSHQLSGRYHLRSKD